MTRSLVAKHRRAAALALCLVAVGLLWVALRSRTGVAPVHRPEMVSTELGASQEDPRATAVPAVNTRVAQPLQVVTPAGARPRGTLVIEDDRGDLFPRESGVIRVLRDGAVSEISVVDGAWDPSMGPDVPYRVSGIVVGGREAILSSDRGLLIDPNTDVALRAIWLGSSQLHVVDAETGTELDEVCLYRLDGLAASDVENPTSVRGAVPLGSTYVSPITLTPTLESLAAGSPPTYYAYRPGYAWGSVAPDSTRDGDVVLRLERGADILVNVVGDPPTASVALRCFRLQNAQRKLLWEQPLRARASPERKGVPWRIQGLRSGEYLIAIGRSESDGDIVSSVASVQPPQDTNVTLALPRGLSEVVVPVALSVQFDSSWQLDDFLVGVTAIDTPRSYRGRYQRVRKSEMTDHGDGMYSSSLRLTAPGRYSVQVDPAGYGFVQALLPEGPHEIRVQVPVCAGLSVHVMEKDSGLPIRDASVCWTSQQLADSEGAGCNRPQPQTPGHFLFQAPVGAIALEVSGGEGPWTAERRTIDLQGGLQEIIIELAPAPQIRVSLYDGDRRVDWPMPVFQRLSCTDRQSQPLPRRDSLNTGTGCVTITLEAPQQCVVTVPQLDGFEPTLPIELDLTQVPLAEVVVALKRLHKN